MVCVCNHPVCWVSFLFAKAGIENMKYSLRSSFSRLILALFVLVLLLTIVGRVVTITGAWAFCAGWPMCIPTEPLGYLKLAHVALVGVASVFMVLIWRKSWRDPSDSCFSFAFGGFTHHDSNCIMDFFRLLGFCIGCFGKRYDRSSEV